MTAEPRLKSRSEQQEWLSWSPVPRAASPRLGWGSLTPSSQRVAPSGAGVGTEGQSRSEGRTWGTDLEVHWSLVQSPQAALQNPLCRHCGPHSQQASGEVGRRICDSDHGRSPEVAAF